MLLAASNAQLCRYRQFEEFAPQKPRREKQDLQVLHLTGIGIETRNDLVAELLGVLALPQGRTSAGSSKLRPRSRQKEHLQPYRPASHPARLQPPLPRIPLHSGRLLSWHPSARPSYPTPCRQRPHRQGPQLLQPCRADSACRPATSQLQHQRPPPRRPRPASRPMLTANPHQTPCPSTPTRRH